MVRTRRRILGGYAGLCATFIAKLADNPAPTVRTLLRPYGTAKKNTLTPQDVGELINFLKNKKKMRELRRELKEL